MTDCRGEGSDTSLVHFLCTSASWRLGVKNSFLSSFVVVLSVGGRFDILWEPCYIPGADMKSAPSRTKRSSATGLQARRVTFGLQVREIREAMKAITGINRMVFWPFLLS